MHELDVTLNNGFKHIWRDNIKAASIFCPSTCTSPSYLIEERQLMFFSKLQRTESIV